MANLKNQSSPMSTDLPDNHQNHPYLRMKADAQAVDHTPSSSYPSYHTQAQRFIKSSHDLGYTTQPEGDEIIAYPPGTPKKVPSVTDRVVDAVKMAGQTAKAFVTNATGGDIKKILKK